MVKLALFVLTRLCDFFLHFRSLFLRRSVGKNIVKGVLKTWGTPVGYPNGVGNGVVGIICRMRIPLSMRTLTAITYTLSLRFLSFLHLRMQVHAICVFTGRGCKTNSRQRHYFIRKFSSTFRFLQLVHSLPNTLFNKPGGSDKIGKNTKLFLLFF